jgi:hypothetical protein
MCTQIADKLRSSQVTRTKIVVFAHHAAVIDVLMRMFLRIVEKDPEISAPPLKIDGKVSYQCATLI